MKSNASGVPAEVLSLWGKSNAGGRPTPLLQHLLDAAAVADLFWTSFASPGLRARLDAATTGRGRSVLRWLCALHDLGKATPAFQLRQPELAGALSACGLLTVSLTRLEVKQGPHAVLGARVLKRLVEKDKISLDRAAFEWLWPLIAGHHGRIPGWDALSEDQRKLLGDSPEWLQVQADLVSVLESLLGARLCVIPNEAPPHALQLALAGAVVVCDWIASDERHFPGLAGEESVGLDRAGQRAHAAWGHLRLRGGWRAESLLCEPAEALGKRFPFPARPLQQAVASMAGQVPRACIMTIEAPMGEGKTEAALAAVEVLARRFGLDGFYLAMPTQATADAIYDRLIHWVGAIDPDVPLGLLHGKRRFNPNWRAIEREVRLQEIDDEDDPYGSANQSDGTFRALPSEWLLGRKRGLLMPIVVGTIDQLLFAAARVRHVMVHYAGLANRVVVIDEVHAYDAYMSQFLKEALRWLGSLGVPVLLLSATLPSSVRRDLMEAYVNGPAHSRRCSLPCPAGAKYPLVSAVWPEGSGARSRSIAPRSALRPSRVRVEVIPEADDDSATSQVVSRLEEMLAAGGCALVICNTVRRAQRRYSRLRDAFGGDVRLLHARLTVAERARRTEELLNELGSRSRGRRPTRRVVVATQVAEQSLDLDADVLVSDLAPIDLLLQRTGRLHRHPDNDSLRPEPVASPTLIVTGAAWRHDAVPQFPAGSERVYGRALLLRAAALIEEVLAEGGCLSLPDDIPRLVSRGYDAGGEALWVPPGWGQWDKVLEDADAQWRKELEKRTRSAQEYLLDGGRVLSKGESSLAGLHARAVMVRDEDEEQVGAVVRYGEPSVEVALLTRQGERYRTLEGQIDLGCQGEAAEDSAVLEATLGSVVRLPADARLTEEVKRTFPPLPAWLGGRDPWLARLPAMVLESGEAVLPSGTRLRYDPELGLEVEYGSEAGD